MKYISGGQPSPYELTFGVELGQNLHYKMISESILDPLKWVTHHVMHEPSPKVLGVRGYVGKNPSPTLTQDNVKIEYISKK